MAFPGPLATMPCLSSCPHSCMRMCRWTGWWVGGAGREWVCGWSMSVCPRRLFASHHQFSPPHPPSFPSAIETTAFVCVLLLTPSTHTDSFPLPPTHTQRHRSHLFVLRDSSTSNHGNVRVGVVEERRGGGEGGGDDDAYGQCLWTSYTPPASAVLGTFNVARVS